MKKETEVSRRNFLKTGIMAGAAMAASPILNQVMASGESLASKYRQQ